MPGVARGLNPRLGAHRLLASMMVVAALACYLRGQSWGDSIASAVAVLLAWAVVRELDPDRGWTAQVAAAAVGAFALLHTQQHVDLMATTAALFAVRVVLASTGRPLAPADIALVMGVAWFAADSRSGLAATIVMIAGMCLHVVRTRRARDRPTESVVMAAIVITGAAAAAAGTAAMSWPLAEGTVVFGWIPPAATTLIAGIALIALREPTRSACDSARGRFSTPPAVGAWRVQAARACNAMVLTTAFAADGPGAISALAPIWIATCSAGAGVLASQFSSRHMERTGDPQSP